MRESHANKSISFLMELIFVLFLFTLASAVSVSYTHLTLPTKA